MGLLSVGVETARGWRFTSAPNGSPGEWSVRCVGPIELPAGQPTVAQLADGTVWRRSWSGPDSLIVDFLGPVAAVDEANRHVDIAGTDDQTLIEHLVLDHVVPLLLIDERHHVLHGATIGDTASCLVLAGPTGAGKSTLAAACLAAGWSVGNDDGAVVDLATGCAEPTYASVRVTPQSAALLELDRAALGSAGAKLRLPPDRFDAAARPLAAVVLLERGEVLPTLERLDPLPAHAAVFGASFHRDLIAKESLSEAMLRISTIVENTPVFRLRMPHERAAISPAIDLLRALLA